MASLLASLLDDVIIAAVDALRDDISTEVHRTQEQMRTES